MGIDEALICGDQFADLVLSKNKVQAIVDARPSLEGERIGIGNESKRDLELWRSRVNIGEIRLGFFLGQLALSM